MRYLNNRSFLSGFHYMEHSEDMESHFYTAAMAASKIHQEDPEIILQAGLFEIVDAEVERILIPEWVLKEFELPVSERVYRYTDMLYRNGSYIDFYGEGVSIPDISRIETGMWFFHRACRYIDNGYEAVHFGIADVVSMEDPDHHYFSDLLDRIRAYAHSHARRRMVLCDAHHTTGWVLDGKTVFDFLSYPLRYS